MTLHYITLHSKPTSQSQARKGRDFVFLIQKQTQQNLFSMTQNPTARPRGSYPAPLSGYLLFLDKVGTKKTG